MIIILLLFAFLAVLPIGSQTDSLSGEKRSSHLRSRLKESSFFLSRARTFVSWFAHVPVGGGEWEQSSINTFSFRRLEVAPQSSWSLKRLEQ